MKDKDSNTNTLESNCEDNEYIRHVRRMKERQRQKEQYCRDKMRTKIVTVCGIVLLITIITIIAVRQRCVRLPIPQKPNDVIMVIPAKNVGGMCKDFKLSV